MLTQITLITYEVNSVIVSMAQMKKEKQREVKQLAQGHTALGI